MRVLIIGMGYAGTRYWQAFTALSPELGPIEIAHASRSPNSSPVPGYTSIAHALDNFVPDLVVVTVNDVNRADVLRELVSYRGTIVCEKPLITSSDSIAEVDTAFGDRDSFYVAQIERYSQAARDLKLFARTGNARAVRGSFFWAKNRIGDPRPTSGVISEIIHPIDLLQWILSDGRETMEKTVGTIIRSDFSISGDSVIDTALATGTIAGTPVAGYSSFVGLERMRSIQLTLSDGSPSPIYATATFDSPVWDADQLRVWRLTDRGLQDELITRDYAPDTDAANPGLRKQIRLCRDLIEHVRNPSHQPDLPQIGEALDMQRVLNALASGAGPTTQYFGNSERFRLAADASSEVLG